MSAYDYPDPAAILAQVWARHEAPQGPSAPSVAGPLPTPSAQPDPQALITALHQAQQAKVMAADKQVVQRILLAQAIRAGAAGVPMTTGAPQESAGAGSTDAGTPTDGRPDCDG